MTCPRVEVRLDRVGRNARTLVDRLGSIGIAVCGVTKATGGSPKVARELLAGGVTALAESRVENVERLRRAGIATEIVLVRSPMPSQAERVVAAADISLNSEVDVIELLSSSAVRAGRLHGVVLMIELGDLREGLMPGDVLDAARRVASMPGVVLRGVGVNLACQSGVIPDASNMAELSAVAVCVEADLGVELELVSGGNSANLAWALKEPAETGRINHLRLGESILLGRDPLTRAPIAGLATDAFTVVGEVIESKIKPTRPRGSTGQNAFGDAVGDAVGIKGRDRSCRRVIVALGRQDVDPDGLEMPEGYRIVGASSDHLVVEAGCDAPVPGAELRFGVNYSALLRAMTSASVLTCFTDEAPA